MSDSDDIAPTSLYVIEQGSRLHRVGGRLLVRDRDRRVLKDVPLFRLDRVLLFGNVEVTTEALVQIVRKGIDLVYLTRTGQFKCRANPLRLEDAELRILQYRLSLDEERRLAAARKMVAAKIGNCRVLLRRATSASPQMSGALLPKLKQLASEAERAPNLEYLRGIEGAAAREYFSGFGARLKQDLGFLGRARRPPRDPVNSLLSFGYTLLYSQVLSAVNSAGLDPYQGVLHAIRKGRPSLPLDLMEELRPLVDGVVLALVNRVTLTARDFRMDQKLGCRMTDRALGRFVDTFHARMRGTVHHDSTGRTVSYSDFIRVQARGFADLIRRNTEYLPLCWR